MSAVATIPTNPLSGARIVRNLLSVAEPVQAAREGEASYPLATTSSSLGARPEVSSTSTLQARERHAADDVPLGHEIDEDDWDDADRGASHDEVPGGRIATVKVREANRQRHEVL